MQKDFSFVILTWNRVEMLKICTHALLNSIENKEKAELIILDNHSTDSTWSFLKDFKSKNRDIKIKILRSPKNFGLASYKFLFFIANGKYQVVVDDDVLEFPNAIDAAFTRYHNTFENVGFLALDVVQDELTNGAKPGSESYSEIHKDGLTLQLGPTGGWCSCFNKRNFPMYRFYLKKINFKSGDDTFIYNWSKAKQLKSGIMKGFKCLHASGPYYSKKFGLLKRDIEKYQNSELYNYVEKYKSFEDK